MPAPRTQTLTVPGATLTCYVRDAEGETTRPVLLMIAAPLDASGFAATLRRVLDEEGGTQ